jgi:hypothetical protein
MIRASLGDEGGRVMADRFGAAPDDRFLNVSLNRRGFLGMSAVLAASGLLAACKKAEDGGTTVGAPSQATRLTMDEEPGGLQVFDWSGYGNGDYYPKEEKQFLWRHP